MASATKELSFKFCLNLKSHMWLVASLLDSAAVTATLGSAHLRVRFYLFILQTLSASLWGSLSKILLSSGAPGFGGGSRYPLCEDGHKGMTWSTEEGFWLWVDQRRCPGRVLEK